MSKLCIKCNGPLEEKDDDTFITQGICTKCKSDINSMQGPTKLATFLNQFDLPVVALDGDRQMIAANDAALALTGRNLEESLFMFGGDFMNCKYASLPEGCGFTEHCTACVIKNSVVKTHETGMGFDKIEADLTVVNGDKETKLKFIISTELEKDLVLLRFDEVHQQ